MLNSYLDSVLGLYERTDAIIITDCKGFIEYSIMFSNEVNNLKSAHVTGMHILENYPSLTEETSSIMRVLKNGQEILDERQMVTNYRGEQLYLVNSTFPIKVNGEIIGAIEASVYGDKTLLERLNSVLADSFVRLSYTEGIKILEEAVASGHKFEFPVSWGMDLASEHERFLVEQHFRKPVIMHGYPKEIKAFYMKINPDGKTVQGTDVLFPQIGEIIGGSVREEDYGKLLGEIEGRGIPMKDMWWYLDTRKYGSCPHGGFGLGFERLILFVTGMQNIRDVIPFPRTPKSADF